jgi:hypothetical protein
LVLHILEAFNSANSAVTQLIVRYAMQPTVRRVLHHRHTDVMGGYVPSVPTSMLH